MLFAHPPKNFLPAKRIISLIPSVTEWLYRLGLTKETIAITFFCIHPAEWYKTKNRIGGPKKLHVEEIISLKPDLVIAGKEENIKEQVEAIALHAPVLLTDVITTNDAFEMMEDIAILTDRHSRGLKFIEELKDTFNHFSAAFSIRAAYLIWKDPYMSVGGDTFIHHMMKVAGLENVFKEHQRYPTIDVQDIINAQTEVVLLSSEPYPFKQKHAEELSRLLPEHIKIILVDGEMFSWYGSRMMDSIEYFKSLPQEIFYTE